MTKLDELKMDLLNLNLKNTDTLMIHSSYSSIKEIDANALLDEFINIVKDGLLLFPTHTWNMMKEDNMIFNKNEANSCVGYLTNVAIKKEGFIRSNHPTHSIVAYGKNAYDYIKDDNDAKSPCYINGSFGKLRMGGYILFLGAPLSKNTFIHSIEEYMNVPNRFTDHIYKFMTLDNDNLIEFNMPRHYNALCPHISDNYEKLLPFMLNNGVAKRVKILNTVSYLVDAKKCFKMVTDILKKDIHAFDDNKDISNLID